MDIATSLKEMLLNKEVDKVEILTTKDPNFAVCYINGMIEKPLFLNKRDLTILTKGGAK